MSNKKKNINSIKKKKIIIFTCGYYGRSIYRKLFKNNKILYFFDNFSKHKSLFGTKIIKPTFLKQTTFDFIALAGRDIKKLKTQLIKLGYKNNQIKIFNNIELRPNASIRKIREKTAVKLFKKIILGFKKLNIWYVCDYSGLLSLIRDKKLASFSDFELGLKLEDYKKVLKYLTNKNFIIKYKTPSKYKNKIYKHFYVTNSKYLNKKVESPRYSFLFLYKTNGGYRDIIKKRFRKEAFFLKSNKIFIKNLEFRIPNNHLQLLKNLYGKNWRTPSSFWSG